MINSDQASRQFGDGEATGDKETATELRLRLRDAGFSPIPVEGKKPSLNNWTDKHEQTDDQIALWEKVYPYASSTGLLTKYTPAIDIDIYNPEAAEELEELAREHFGDRGQILVRFGRPPKRAILLRTEEPFSKEKLDFDEPRNPDDKNKKQGVEILADGQQLVAFGLHPETHAPYRWYGGKPGEVGREDLPCVQREDIVEFLSQAEKILNAHGYKKDKTGTNGHDTGAQDRRSSEPRADIKRVRAALNVIPNSDEHYDTWIEIGMATWAAVGGRAQGFTAWDEWSKKSGKYHAAITAKTWASFHKRPPHSIGAGTLFYKAAEVNPDWENAKASDLPRYVERLNRKHAVLLQGAKVVILWEEGDAPRFTPPADFHLWYANDKVEITVSDTVSKFIPVSRLWIAHPARRQYLKVVFDPRDTDPRHYNLWRGFFVEPDATKSCARSLAHIRDNICGGNEEHYKWVMAFLAHMVQRPWEKPGVSLVLRGNEGVGKGFFANVIGELSPQHYVVVSQAAQLTGKFNAHFQQALLVFVDEAFWAGDKAGEGALKHLVTDEELLIEGKHRDAFMVRNLSRLIIASNEKWVVPAGIRARRWCVLDVADTRANDRAYFSAIDDELHRDGGLAGLMHVLQTFDLGSVNVYTPPKTAALLEQKEESFPPHVQWWLEILESGTIRYPSEKNPDSHDFNKADKITELEWPSTLPKQRLWESYRLWSQLHNVRSRVLPAGALYVWLNTNELLPGSEASRPRDGTARKRVLHLPPLLPCRAAFDTYMAQPRSWEAVDADFG